MRFVALVSGGKDSIYSIVQCIQQGHELVACVHLGAPRAADNEGGEESYMYQTAGSEAVDILVRECIGVPLIQYQRKGKSLNTSLVYGEKISNHKCSDPSTVDKSLRDLNDSPDQVQDATEDEVEDLYRALLQSQQQFPEIEAVCSGAILSTYQRLRIEQIVCNRLNWTSLGFLWRKSSQQALLQEMINYGIEAVLVRTAAPPGLIPRQHLNKSIRQLQQHFLKLNDQYQFHICGEGGEYETLVLDCPQLFQKRLVFDEVEIIESNDDNGTGVLFIKKCHAEDKIANSVFESSPLANQLVQIPDVRKQAPAANACEECEVQDRICQLPRCVLLPHVRRVSGGLLAISEILSTSAHGDRYPKEHEVQDEAKNVFHILQATLQYYDCSSIDVLFVHLYLSQISFFASINFLYKQFFGTLLPPSRSCVAVGTHVLSGNRNIMLSCYAQCGSGQYLRASTRSTLPSSQPSEYRNTLNPYTRAAFATTSSRLRQVLHVQSISHWAPVCVGPYSQVNSVRDCIHFIAGQIGLIPSTMTLHPTWIMQLQQAWKNVASILDALDGGSIQNNMLSGFLYVADSAFHAGDNLQQIGAISLEQIASNADVKPGRIDNSCVKDSSMQECERFEGYEDEETMLHARMKTEMLHHEGSVDHKPTSQYVGPILVVTVSELPLHALVEIELLASTRTVSSSLQRKQCNRQRLYHLDHIYDTNTRICWDTGHDFTMPVKSNTIPYVIDSYFQCFGSRTTASAIITASTSSDDDLHKRINVTEIIDMVSFFSFMLQELESDPTILDLSTVLQLRLYYIATVVSKGSMMVSPNDDGIMIRSAFQSACSGKFSNSASIPAITVVPVRGLHNITAINTLTTCTVQPATGQTMKFALFAFGFDPVHTETCMRINQGP